MATTALQQIVDGGTFPLSSAMQALADGSEVSIGKIDVSNAAGKGPFEVVLEFEASITGGTLAALSAGSIVIKVGYGTGTAGTFPDTNNTMFLDSVLANTAGKQMFKDVIVPVHDWGIEVWVKNILGTALATGLNGAQYAVTWRAKTIALV